MTEINAARRRFPIVAVPQPLGSAMTTHSRELLSSAALLRARALPAASDQRPWWEPHLGMLPLDALVIAAAGTLAGGAALGAWPLLTVLACPLLHLSMGRG